MTMNRLDRIKKLQNRKVIDKLNDAKADEVIEALNIKQGEKGDDGLTGIQGKQGLPGVPGQRGKDGANGKNGEPGQVGIPGKMGVPGLQWQGAWKSATMYKKGDAVTNWGSSWICTVAHESALGNQPMYNVTNEYWELLALKGEEGAGGRQGANGANGSPGVGVPVGGTTGQVLAKIDNTNFNTQWVDQTGGSGGAVSSVSNSDNTLTVTPTTGNVVASLNLGATNTWTGAQTFNTTPIINAVPLSFVHDGTSLTNYSIISSHINFQDQLIFNSTTSGQNAMYWFDSLGSSTTSTLTIANNGTPEFALSAASGVASLSGGSSNDIEFITDGGSRTSLTIHHFTQKVNTLNNTLDDGSGNATFSGTIGASNFSGSSSGTNTGDQTLSGLGGMAKSTYDAANIAQQLVGLTATQTLTNKTLTSPTIGTSILDTNGNNLFLFTATGSAVNYLTYKNNATTFSPSFTATGSDTNISINLVPKGTGTVLVNGITVPTLSSTSVITNKDLTSGTNTFPTFNQNTTGNSATATALQTGRTINGTTFDGTANIVVTAAAGTLTGTTLNSTVVTSSLTSVGTLTNLTVTNAIAGSITGNATNLSGTPTLPNGTSATTQSPADSSTKLATTAYVDNAVLGQDFKQAVALATTSSLGTYVYNNGSSGVGATITLVATGVVAFDGTNLTLGMRVLVKNETSTLTPNNGIYTVTTAGALGVALVLTRATDFNQSSEIDAGDSVFVTGGSTQGTTTWAYNGITAPTMGTTNITFAQTAGQGSFTSGNGITITGLSIAINTSVTVDKTTAQTLTNKTLTTPVLNGTPTGTGVSSTPTAATLALWDANLNLSANNLNEGFTTTATATSTTTLTIASTGIQVFTGTATQTVLLPTTGVIAGTTYQIINQSTGAVTVQSSGANTIEVMAGNTFGTFTAVAATPSTAAGWTASYVGLIVTSGKEVNISNTLTLAGTDSTTMTFPTTSATIARTDAGQTFTGNQTITGTTTSADTTILAVTGVQTAARTQFFVTNLAAASTSAKASFALQAQTSIGTRTGFQFDVSFSTTTDASRTSTVVFNVASGGTFGVVMQFTGQAIGVFGATPVAQQGATGNLTITTAGSTNTVFRNTTFTGGAGTTAYTIGDIILALKNFGWIAT